MSFDMDTKDFKPEMNDLHKKLVDEFAFETKYFFKNNNFHCKRVRKKLLSSKPSIRSSVDDKKFDIFQKILNLSGK